MNFFLLFRVYLFKILFKFNYIVRKTVNEKKVLSLIKSFKIYKTNYKLIRLGEVGDGGYLLPDDLLEISACFSGGAGNTVKFEYDLANLGIKCFIADYSVNNLPPPHHQNFIFLKKFLGIENSDEYINFNEYIDSNIRDKHDYILKLDVEGDEYVILLNLLEQHLKKMRIIVLEFHNFVNILTPLGFEIIKMIFTKLQKNHSIVHICPNNITPKIKFSKQLTLFDQLEITFLRNDRITEKQPAKIFPHPLDSENNFFFDKKLPETFFKD